VGDMCNRCSPPSARLACEQYRGPGTNRYPSSRRAHHGDADQPCLAGPPDRDCRRSRRWQEVINQLREVDQIFSTYRDDSIRFEL
jgi:hypothetical protein